MREVRNILEVLTNTVTDIVLRFGEHLNVTEENQWKPDILNEIGTIIEYANGCFNDISATYSSKRIQITNIMELR
jgi:hypothetical protein